MKGRRLRGTRLITTLVIGSITAGLAACGDGGGGGTAATLPAESVLVDDDTLLTATEETSIVSTLAPTTLAPSPTTSATPATTVAETAAPTVVETLPTPAAPPEPRADEPYVELGTLEIPKLGVAQTLLEGITLNTLDVGPGHWPGTAMPGKMGNVVVAGHRTSHGKVFRNIDQLVAGDEVIFNVADGRFVYVVTSIDIVQPDALYIIDQTPESTATLFACHPPGSIRQRIVANLSLQVDPATTG